METLRKVGATIGWAAFLCLRGVLLWLFLFPSIIPWLAGLVAWLVLRPFGVRVPVSLFFYARWATYLLDALLTRITPRLESSPWPWRVDVRNSRISSWDETFDWSLS